MIEIFFFFCLNFRIWVLIWMRKKPIWIWFWNGWRWDSSTRTRRLFLKDWNTCKPFSMPWPKKATTCSIRKHRPSYLISSLRHQLLSILDQFHLYLLSFGQFFFFFIYFSVFLVEKLTGGRSKCPNFRFLSQIFQYYRVRGQKSFKNGYFSVFFVKKNWLGLGQNVQILCF